MRNKLALVLLLLVLFAPGAQSQTLSQFTPATALSDTDTWFVCQNPMPPTNTGCDSTHPIFRGTLPQISNYVIGKIPPFTVTATPPLNSTGNNLSLSYDSTLTVVGGQLHAVATGGGGTGNVTGPSSSVNGDVAAFSGTTGTVISDSGVMYTSLLTITGTATVSNKTINCASNTCTVRLGSDVIGNLPVSNLAGGSGATAATFWNGAGVWSAVPYSSLASGTNTTGALLIGTGASLGPTGTGTITATTMPATGLTGTIAAAQMPAFTGDLSVAAGSTSATFNTVNANVGSFNNANITVNAKGLVTAAANGSGTGVSITAADTSIVVSPSPITGSGTVAVGGPSHLTTFTAGTVPMGAGTSPLTASEITDVALGGVVVGAATGGAKGAGSINMQACFVNNVACSTGSSTAFGTITGGTNTAAAMVVGTGASIGATGTGAITATAMPATGLTGTMNAAQLPAHTGDVTSPAGSAVNTLATVNSNVGTFTNPTITVNGKGLVTAASSGASLAGFQYVLATTVAMGGGL